jgi:HD-like signal output (HDOD) protein
VQGQLVVGLVVQDYLVPHWDFDLDLVQVVAVQGLAEQEQVVVLVVVLVAVDLLEPMLEPHLLLQVLPEQVQVQVQVTYN